MKNSILVVVVLLIATTTNVAQDFYGTITYKYKNNLSLKIDSVSKSNALPTEFAKMFKKQFDKTFTLNFNKTESLYFEEKELETTSFDIVIMSNSNATNGLFYKNTKKQEYVIQTESFGKLFLIKDTLKALSWKLENEKKHIGKHICYKATLTEHVKESSWDSHAGESDHNSESTPKTIEKTITAWYTPDIPVNTGPKNYYGLPGLILEINDGTENIVCTQITLNPKNKKPIKVPVKGKEISQEKYDLIMEKKQKEWDEKMKKMHQNSNGDHFNIIISD